MANLNALYGDLNSNVQELAAKFVDKFIPADPAASPSIYELDVRAYCVLSHAAFEDFIEAVVLAVCGHAVDQWITARKTTDVVLALLCWNGAKLTIDDDENSPETKPFDYLRPLVENAKAAFSREVHMNHGVSVRYLRSLLIPVNIEVPQDANLLNSLGKLAEGRGTYAHKGRVKSVLVPEDAKRYVEDVLRLCDNICKQAVAKLA
ncbi:MAG TPA: HEPN domain-containing protein [Pyrinomonadaceae bacterium]